jgi:hypothetical protein
MKEWGASVHCLMAYSKYEKQVRRNGRMEKELENDCKTDSVAILYCLRMRCAVFNRADFINKEKKQIGKTALQRNRG